MVEAPITFIALSVVLTVLARVLQGFFKSAVSVEVGSIKAEFDRESEDGRDFRAESVAAPDTIETPAGPAITHGSGLVEAVGDGRLADFTRHLERLIQERARLVEELDERNEVLLKEYHAHGLAQSRVAFQFSLVFASLGFLLISGSVAAALFDEATDASLPALVSGTVVEAVAGLFFVQSNRARNVMTSFFEKARVDRSLNEGLRLAEEVPDPLIRSRLQTVLALRLAKADATDAVVRTIMAPDELRSGDPASAVEPVVSDANVDPTSEGRDRRGSTGLRQ